MCDMIKDYIKCDLLYKSGRTTKAIYVYVHTFSTSTSTAKENEREFRGGSLSTKVDARSVEQTNRGNIPITTS